MTSKAAEKLAPIDREINRAADLAAHRIALTPGSRAWRRRAPLD